ncbi:MAG: ferrous iron transport protein B [Syntrophaceae bacterium]|nr:ferrous iron transport protein B [Syntrophaceae bacterium]
MEQSAASTVRTKSLSPGDIPSERRLVLVGNPNVGKSKIFSLLTGEYVVVSNYPGTTVEVRSGKAADLDYYVVDTPGIAGVVPHSDEERVTLKTLLSEGLEAVLQVGDAQNLRRTLLLTMALIEADVPLVLALNLADEAEKKGYVIDAARLSKGLGIPVVQTVAIRGKGREELLDALRRPAKSPLRIIYDARVEEAVTGIAGLLPHYPVSRRAVALTLLSGDPSLVDALLGDQAGESRAIKNLIVQTQSRVLEPLSRVILETRMAIVERLIRECVTLRRGRGFRTRFADRLDRFTTHPVGGALLLLGILYGIYEFVGVFAAGTVVDFFQNVVFGEWLLPPVVGAISHVPYAAVRDFLVGPYGQITMGITYSLAIVFPTVTAFYLVFSILEDTGYLPRLEVMINRLFSLIGLNGKAVIPIVLGFGCGTMAAVVTRILETRRERIIATLILALGIPCAPQMGLILGMFARIGFFALVLFVVLLSVQLMAAGWLASRLLPGQTTAFVAELPPYRLPAPGDVLGKTVYRSYWFVREVIPWFLLGTALLFVADRVGALEALKRLLDPVVVGLLSLPAETTEGFILGFLRREYVAAYFFDIYGRGLMDNLQAFVATMVMTLFVPCVANTFVIIKERGFLTGSGIILFVFIYAIVAGGVLNSVLRLLHVTF